jgi:hypothetical protein
MLEWQLFGYQYGPTTGIVICECLQPHFIRSCYEIMTLITFLVANRLLIVGRT